MPVADAHKFAGNRYAPGADFKQNNRAESQRVKEFYIFCSLLVYHYLVLRDFCLLYRK